MKVYKVKFEKAKAKDEFCKHYRNAAAEVEDFKKKSVLVKAKDKDDVRRIIKETCRATMYYDDYNLGAEGDSYFIKKADEENLER